MNCPACDKLISNTTRSCPYCEYTLPRRWGIAEGPLAPLTVVAIALLIFAVAGILSMFIFKGKSPSANGEVQNAAMQLMQDSTAVNGNLGPHWKRVGRPQGFAYRDRRQGYAELAFTVSGPQGEGNASFIANYDGKVWKFGSARVTMKDGRKLDISPSPQRDPSGVISTRTIYLVPLDKLEGLEIADLIPYYRKTLDVEVKLLPALTLDSSVAEEINVPIPPKGFVESLQRAMIWRLQHKDPTPYRKVKVLGSEKVWNFIVRNEQPYVADPNAVVIGITSRPMRIVAMDWTGAFNYRHLRYGVISTYPMTVIRSLQETREQAVSVRLRKIITRNIALLAYGLPFTLDSSGLMTRAASVPEIDSLGESLLGASGHWMPEPSEYPCIGFVRMPGTKPVFSWDLNCHTADEIDAGYQAADFGVPLGLFRFTQTDLKMPGSTPLKLAWTFEALDPHSRDFGVGTLDNLDTFIMSSDNMRSIDLVLGNNDRVHFNRADKASGFDPATAFIGAEDGEFPGSRLTWNKEKNQFDLKSEDGEVFSFLPCSGNQYCSFSAYSTPDGTRFDFVRDRDHLLQRVNSQDGRGLSFIRDEKNRVIEAEDSSGKTVQYSYDAAGRLASVAPSSGEGLEYEYDAVGRLARVKNSAGIEIMRNEYYDQGGFLKSTVLGDGQSFEFHYEFGANKSVTQFSMDAPDHCAYTYHLNSKSYLLDLPRCNAVTAQQ